MWKKIFLIFLIDLEVFVNCQPTSSSECFSGYVALTGCSSSTISQAYTRVEYSERLGEVLACGYSQCSSYITLSTNGVTSTRIPIMGVYDRYLNNKWIK